MECIMVGGDALDHVINRGAIEVNSDTINLRWGLGPRFQMQLNNTYKATTVASSHKIFHPFRAFHGGRGNETIALAPERVHVLLPKSSCVGGTQVGLGRDIWP